MAFGVNIDPAITAEEGHYLTCFCVLPCLGRGRWMCQTWQWWLWAALRKHSGQLPVRLWSWLWTWSWQKELWRYSALLCYGHSQSAIAWVKCHTFRMLCASSVRSVEPCLENQCSLLICGAGVMSVHGSHLHPMSVTNLASRVLLLVDWGRCKAELRNFPNHLLYYSNSLKPSLPLCIRRKLSAEQCAVVWVSEYLMIPLTTSDWGVTGKVAGLKSGILYSSSKLREILPTPSQVVDFSCWKQILHVRVSKACSSNHLEK